MAILEVLEYLDDSGQNMAYRVGPSVVNMGSQLVVRESQSAVFYRDGKAYDTFPAGRHTLTTQSIPLLGAVVRLPFGGQNPFPVEVVFLNNKEFIDLKWGTKEPVLFRDTEFGMVRLRAFGKFAMKLRDPKVFVGTVLGQKQVYRVSEMEEWLRDSIVQQLNDTLGENLKSILDLAKYYNEIATSMKAKVTGDFQKYGVDITAFVLGAITPPEEVQTAIDKRSALGVIGPAMGTYQQMAAADALRDAAKNPSGMAGMGVGLGAGMMMPQMMAGAMAPAQQPQATEKCPKCQSPVAAGAKFCPNCGLPTGNSCPACKASIPKGAKFCPECGKSTVASCPACKAELAPGAKFCPGCGAKIT